MPTGYVPARGDLVWLAFNPQAGHEQAGVRPALVISPREYNRRTGLALFCPVTSHAKNYPFEVPLPAGLKLQGVILSDQLKSLDWRVRKARHAGQAPPEVLRDVVGRALVLIDPESA